MIKKIILLSCCVGILFLVGCTPSEVEKEKRSTREFTIQEYEAFGKRIAEKVNKRQKDTLDKLFNTDYLIEKISNQIKNKTYADAVRTRAFRNNFKKEVNFGNLIVDELKKKYGHYEFLHFHPRNGIPHLLFRMTSDRGLNYHDYEIRVVDDRLYITDMFIYMSGDYLSQTMNGTIQNLISQQKHLSVIEPEMQTQLENIRKLDEAINQDEYHKALEIYNALPKKTQKGKAFMNYKIIIASNTDSVLYQKTITEYEKLFPDDPSLYLMNIDKYILKGNMGKALWSVNKLDEIVSDQYLDLQRGIIYCAMEKYEKGLELTDNYIRNNVKDPDGYWTRFQIYLMMDEPAKAIETLNEINRYTMFSRMLITEKVEVNYADFAESDAFMTWKENWINRHNERNKWRQK